MRASSSQVVRVRWLTWRGSASWQEIRPQSWSRTTIDTDTTGPYSADWDTTSLADGDYDLRVVTTDEAGNAHTSATRTVTVDNTAPTVTATIPQTANASGWYNVDVSITWSATDAGSGVATGPTPATDRAVVVSVDGILHVVQGDRSFAVSSTDADAVLRAAGISSLDPIPVPASWLDLFTAGTALTPITLQNYGEAVPGTSLRAGQVVRQAGAPEDERFLVQTGGVLESLSPLAWQLYQLGSGSALGGQVTEVTADEIRSLPTATQGLGDEWPDTGFETVAAGQRPCAVLTTGDSGAETALATQPTSTAVTAGVRVDPSHGALVRSGGRGDQNASILTLVDATGTAFPLPGATDETIARLGYTSDQIGTVADGWTALLPTGPSLSEDAAQRTPEAK